MTIKIIVNGKLENKTSWFQLIGLETDKESVKSSHLSYASSMKGKFNFIKHSRLILL